MTPKELGIKYNRNSGTIIGKLKSLGVFIPKKHHFTNDDLNFLKVNYPIGNMDAIKTRFSNVSINSIRSFCSKHNIQADYYGWTENDIEILKKFYYIKTLDEIRIMLNNRFTNDAIQTKAFKLGYSKSRIWSDKELEFLKNNYSIKNMNEIMDGLPRRTYESIIAKAGELGIKSKYCCDNNWKESEVQYLLDNWKTKSDYEISVVLGKNVRSISDKRWANNLLHYNHFSESKYENIKKFIRGNIGTWKSDSMKQCNYKCILTNSKNFEIHHLYNFSSIFNDMLGNNKNIKIKDKLSDYSENELSFILKKFIKEQSKHPLGVCVRKDLHVLFHEVYGKMNNIEQWKNFEKDYKDGKYAQNN